MRKKPYTTKEFFDTITENVLDEHPDIKEIIDYSLASSREQEIRSDQFSPEISIDYGGNEGIYLDFRIRGNLSGNPGQADETIHIGSVKTLCESDDAMYLMGKLNAALVIETYRFLRKEWEDFTWNGYVVFSAMQKPCVGFIASDKKELPKIIQTRLIEKGFQAKSITVKDYSARKLFHVKLENGEYTIGDLIREKEER